MERGSRRVKRVGAGKLALDEAGLRVRAVGYNGSKLAVEGPSDVTVACEDFVVEVDGLVGCGVRFLVIEELDEGKELRCIVLVGAGFHTFNPGSLIGLIDVLLHLLVEVAKARVGGIASANGIALKDEAFG